MSKLSNQIQIVDDYLYENYKTPTLKQFKEHGGDITYIKRKYGNYINFLLENGYDRPSKAKIVQVYNKANCLLCEGTTRHIADVYNVNVSVVRKSCNGKVKFLKGMYKCKYKE